MLFEKAECLASTYKSGSFSDKLPKKDSIYKGVHFILFFFFFGCEFVSSINGGHMDHSALGHVLLDIKSLFSCFSHILVQHITREGNCVAHKLARQAASYPFLV